MRIKLLFAVGAVIVAAKALKHLAEEKMIPGGHSSLGRALLSKSPIFRTRVAYDKDLARAAAYLCEGTYLGQEETEKRMRELGFSDPVSKHYASDTEMNASPITAASEIVSAQDGDYLIVAAAVRGTHPADIGDYLTDIRSGLFNIDGFSDAGDVGTKTAREYCVSRQERYGIPVDHTILFITGHSLGAAVAGQIAGNLEDVVATRQNIFAYTFASPNYETRGKEPSDYKNIHNVINAKDLVPHFPLGSKRYGVDHIFEGKANNPFKHHEMPAYLAGIKSGIDKQ